MGHQRVDLRAIGRQRIGRQKHGRHRVAYAWRRLRVSLLLLAWLLLPPLLLYLISLSKPLYTDRYLIWIGPALLLLLAQGVAALWGSGGRWA
jgi:hypothetical protein